MAYDSSADGTSQGYKGFAGIFATRRKYDFSDKVISKSRVHAKMFNVLSKNMTKMSVTETEPRIFAFTQENDVITINDNPGTGTSFDIANADAQMLQAGDNLSVVINSITSAPSIETIEVVSVGASGGGGDSDHTTVTMRRSVGSQSAINISDGSAYSLIWTGNAIAENAAGPQPRNKEPNYEYNYLQTFAKVIGESRSVKNSEFYAKQFFSMEGEATRKRNMLMKNINMAFYVGERTLGTATDGNQQRMTGGLYEYIPTGNKIDLSGNMTISYWNQQTSVNWFKHGNDRHEKMISAGPTFMTEVENMFHAFGYELKVNEVISKFFGVQIKSFTFSGGTVHFLREEAFLETGFSNCGFVWDPDYIAYMYLQNSDIQVDREVTPRESKWNQTKWIVYGELGLFRTYDSSLFFMFNPSQPS